MDHPDLNLTQTSVEKLSEAMQDLVHAEPADAETAGMLAMLGGLLPLLRKYLPQDPADLDELLMLGAKWALDLRSDAAWQPENLDDIWMRPDKASVDTDAHEEGPA